MESQNYSERYCVIGAGAAGLAVAKNFRDYGIEFDVFERYSEVGGLWEYKRPHSAVYRSTRLISSKPMSQFRGFPMADHLPDYPGQEAVFEYMKAYADRFGLRENITFDTQVESTTRADSYWDVRLNTGEVRRYRGLVLASGVVWKPNVPKFPGEFAGLFLHSLEYKVPEDFAGQRVLVIGGGNSGCDIAADLASKAAKTFLSLRRGYHFIPRHVFGMPSDQFGERAIKMHTPMFLRQLLNRWIVRWILGDLSKLGLPEPDHRMFESHPIVNAEVLEEIRHGLVRVKADVRELRGDRVLFRDGSEEKIDTIVCATGYRICFPYIEQTHLNGPEGKPGFYLHLFHPRYDNLFIVGMIQPASGVWGLMDEQAELIAAYIRANARGSSGARRFDELRAKPQPDLSGGIHYIDSERHFTEIDHTTYRKCLRQSLSLLA